MTTDNTDREEPEPCDYRKAGCAALGRIVGTRWICNNHLASRAAGDELRLLLRRVSELSLDEGFSSHYQHGFEKFREQMTAVLKARLAATSSPVAPSLIPEQEGILEGRTRAYAEAEAERIKRWAATPATATAAEQERIAAIELLDKWLREDPPVEHDEGLERLLRAINENSLSNRVATSGAREAAEEIARTFDLERPGWVTLGRITIDRETETEKFERTSETTTDRIEAIISRHFPSAVPVEEQDRSALDEIEVALISVTDGVSPADAVQKAFEIINRERRKIIG